MQGGRLTILPPLGGSHSLAPYPSVLRRDIGADLFQVVLAAHVGTQHFGDDDAAVGLKVVLKEGDQHTGRRHAGVVQRVGAGSSLARLSPLDADASGGGPGRRPGWSRSTPRSTSAGGGSRPRCRRLLTFRSARSPEQHSSWRTGMSRERNSSTRVSATASRTSPWTVLGLADHDHLLLFKLVDAVDAALLQAVGALLLAEAGGVGGQGLGQLLLGDDLVDELADHGVLAGADEVQVLALDLVHHGVHLGQGS